MDLESLSLAFTANVVGKDRSDNCSFFSFSGSLCLFVFFMAYFQKYSSHYAKSLLCNILLEFF